MKKNGITISIPPSVLEALKNYREKFHINMSLYVTSLIKTDLISKGELKYETN